MNDDDLLFGFDDLDRLKRADQPARWLGERKNVLLARLNAQSKQFHDLLMSANHSMARRLNKPL